MDRSLLIKLFNIALYLFIAGHLIMLTVYVLPHERASNALTGISDLYMSKLFHQEWDLFAPEPPGTSVHLEYILYDKDGLELETIAPADQPLNAQLSFRSITATKRVYLDRRYASYLLDDQKLIAGVNKQGATPFSVLAALRYCAAHAKHHSNSEWTGMALVVYENWHPALSNEVFRTPTYSANEILAQ